MPFTVASGVPAATVLLRIATAAPEKSLAAPSEGLGALDATADRVARSQFQNDPLSPGLMHRTDRRRAQDRSRR